MDFIKTRKIFYLLSLILILVSILAMIFWHFRWGIDFKSGTLWEVQLKNNSDLLKIETILRDNGIVSYLIQKSNDNIIFLRFNEISEETHQKLLSLFKEQISDIKELSFSSIGPSIGKSLIIKSLWGVGLVLLGILLYLIYAFRQASFSIPSYKYGILAIIALIHDSIIVTGFLVIMGKLLGWELNSDFLVALLTILGYSVHDTIVVYDRIRENLKMNALKNIKLTKEELAKVINLSIKQNFWRALNTSNTTLIPLIALLIWGPDSIKILTSAMIVGIIIGTYSSICVASALLYDWFS
ncbi:MAG: protein translocase subunit SecF [Minisyncoccia bacterium]